MGHAKVSKLIVNRKENYVNDCGVTRQTCNQKQAILRRVCACTQGIVCRLHNGTGCREDLVGMQGCSLEYRLFHDSVGLCRFHSYVHRHTYLGHNA